MGNLPALAAVKVTLLSTVIFTSLRYIPIVPVVSKDVTLSSMCLFIAFDVGSGTFHSVKQTVIKPLTNSNPGTSSSVNVDTKAKSCNCGRGLAKSDPDRKFCK